MTGARYELEFAGGGTLTGSAEQIIDAWGAMAFGLHADPDHDKARAILADRVWAWCGAEIDAGLDDDAFLRAVAATGMVALYETRKV